MRLLYTLDIQCQSCDPCAQLVERRELQALQNERRTLFARIDDSDAESRALRDLVQERDATLATLRADLAQVRETAIRQDALRCEERDTARQDAAAAERRATEASEARATAETQRAALAQSLALAEVEVRHSREELIQTTELLSSARAEARAAGEALALERQQLQAEVARERERAAAADARVRELEPAREAALREHAAMAERLSVALERAATAEEAGRQKEEQRKQTAEELEAAIGRAEAAEARAAAQVEARAAAETHSASLLGRIGTIEAEASSAAEAARVSVAREHAETAELRARLESTEVQRDEVEQQRRTISESLHAARLEYARLEGMVARADERLLAEQVRLACVHDPWA